MHDKPIKGIFNLERTHKIPLDLATSNPNYHQILASIEQFMDNKEGLVEIIIINLKPITCLFNIFCYLFYIIIIYVYISVHLMRYIKVLCIEIYHQVTQLHSY